MGKWEQWRDRGGRVGRGVGQRAQEWDRGTRSGTEGPVVGQRDHGWDRRTRGETGVGQRDYRWGRGGTEGL